MADETADLRKYTHGPLRWPGAKNKSFHNILIHLPLRQVFVDVFGGSGAILINRPNSKLDVYNDIHRGLVSFYRCLQDVEKCRALCDLIEFSIYSRYEFDRLKVVRETTDDIVLRAFAWFYTVQYSFSGLSDSYGRITSGSGSVKGIRNQIPMLWHIHRRLEKVQIEELDFRRLIDDYDSANTVFYCDPPYIDKDVYNNEQPFTRDDHLDLINLAQTCEGYFAISGYPNPIYNDFKWDHIYTWEQTTHMTKTLNVGERKSSATEVLWIKDNL